MKASEAAVPAGAGASPEGWALLERLRPEVLQAQGALMRRLGASLPPTTRQLLFVTLSVLQCSERALRRHATRALASGAAKDHLVDAVVMALPVAGPARVAEALRVVEGILALSPIGEEPEP